MVHIRGIIAFWRDRLGSLLWGIGLLCCGLFCCHFTRIYRGHLGPITNKVTLSLLQQNYCEVSYGGELRGGVNPLKDRLKLDNCVTPKMQVVMKLVRVASNLHLRNWQAPDAFVQEIIPVAS